MSKKLFLIIAASLICLAASAQKKGEMYIGGSIGITGGSTTTELSSGRSSISSDTPSATKFMLAPEFGYFFADRWRVSGFAAYEFLKDPSSKASNDEWLNNELSLFSIGAEIAYYLPIAKNFWYVPSFNARIGGGQLNSDISTNEKMSYDVVSATIGLNLLSFDVRVSDRIGLNIGLINLGVTSIQNLDDDDITMTVSSVDFKAGIETNFALRYYF